MALSKLRADPLHLKIHAGAIDQVVLRAGPLFLGDHFGQTLGGLVMTVVAWTRTVRKCCRTPRTPIRPGTSMVNSAWKEMLR